MKPATDEQRRQRSEGSTNLYRDFCRAVLVERPRLGRGVRKPGRRRKQRYRNDPESAPRRESNQRDGTRELNENLAPMRRFLRRRVGSLWDDVYSEICTHIRLTHTVQKHVRDHVDDMVAKGVVIRDGQAFAISRFGSFEYYPLGQSRYRTLYVCPQTGRLCEVPYARRRKIGRARGCRCSTCRSIKTREQASS